MDDLAARLKNMTPLQRAVYALKETQTRLEALERRRAEPIAVVGMACRFPGQADNPEAYWRLLCAGVDAVGEVPPDRWDVDAFYDPDPAAPGKMCTRWGGFLKNIDRFDNHFFGISDREASRIDPQHRILLELTWEALEDAGLPPADLRGQKIGVFVGIAQSEYGLMLSSDLDQTDAHVAAGTSLCLAANRLSFVFGLHGPSLSLDTACSSSLVAMHLACQSIRSGDCDAALVGGANMLLSPIGTINLTKAGFCATDGRVHAFDAAATGYVRSEGVGVVVLKPLSAALKNNDPIHAVILGSAVNQNGSSNGLTAPNRAAQEQVLRDAYAQARVSPGAVQYIETQGTGTRLGDAIEATALGNVLRDGRAAGSMCAIGSVKTNLGHLEAASGMASLIKAVLMLERGRMPPSLHFQTPNPEIPFDRLPLHVQSQLTPWPEVPGPRLAGVSAFGFGGSNSHVVLEGPPTVATESAAASLDVLPLSARTEAALRDLARRYVDFLKNDPPSWADVCYTAAARRDHHDCRLSVVARSAEHAAELLEQYLKGQTADGVRAGRKPYGRSLKTAMLFDDRIEPWRSAAAGLAETFCGFVDAAAEVDAAVQRVAGRPLVELLKDPSSSGSMALVAAQLAVAAWWRMIGVGADVVVGRGAGELSAAVIAGVLTLDEALQLAASGVAPQSRAAVLPMLSAVDGQAHVGPDLDAAHWQACLAGRADLWDAAIKSLDDRNVDVRLDVRPLSNEIGKDDDLHSALASLYVAGADLHWARIAPGGARCVRVPTYPWQRQSLWVTSDKWLVGSTKSADKTKELAAATATIRHRPDLTAPYVAPRNALEQKLAELWAEVLELDRVGVHDHFFELGGHSLLAAQAASRMMTQFEVELPLREMFESPTVAGLAVLIEAAQRRGGAKSQNAIVPIPRDGELPLSFNQEALWFLDRLEPERPTYMLHLALNVRGPVRLDVLERSLNEIARRHEVLRTTFPEQGGRPVQRIAPAATQSLRVIDLNDVPADRREARLRREIAAEMNQPIDLQNGPLIRITLYRRGPDDYVSVASTHHIIHDGWSMGVLLYELGSLYMAYSAGKPSPLPELPIQYVDFAAWQRRLLQGETLERLRDYWRNQLTGVPVLELPADRPRPAIRSTRGSSRPCRLSPETSRAVYEFCQREGVTPFMTLLAAFSALLARRSGQNDFAVGVPVANRNRPETESLIGYFVNVLALRTRWDGDPSFRELVGLVRQTALDGFERQEMTLDQVVDAVRPPRDLSRNPIFQVMFALQNLKLPASPELGIQIGPLDDSPAPPSANFDLTLELFERDGCFDGGLGFSTDLFDPATIDRMIGEYQTLVASAMANPNEKLSALPLLDPSQSETMLIQWNDTARDYDRTQLIHHLFERHARQTPDAVAVVAGDRRLTYGELNARANRVAVFLRSQGIGPESRVAICLERSPELFVAVLGVMKAGGAYVPLDASYTRDAQERLHYVLENSQASLIVTDAALDAALGELPVRRVLLDDILTSSNGAKGTDKDVDGGATADRLAYILYTSGSTGRPKGVMVTQGNLLNAFHGWREAYCLDEVHSHLQMASFGFDVFAGDMVRALASGGKLVICRKEILLDAERLLELIEREQVDAAEFVPVVLRNLVQYLEESRRRFDRLRLAVVGSDAWYVGDHRRARAVLGAETRLINSYGLTETTIDSSYFEGDVDLLPESGSTPIGRPFGNVRLYVLDGRMKPTPIGVPGQLYIGGEGVSRGYVDAALNAGRFVLDPFSGQPDARLCCTGDRASRRADGQIDFLGRADHQVKIRGFRVEPAEVEELLREHPLLSGAAVVARQRTAGDVHLVAYVVAQVEPGPDSVELRRFLSQRVPDYMIPSLFVPLTALPTTASGKIDRRSLPEPDWNQTAASARPEYVAPSTPIEEQLARVWGELLNVDRVGAGDNFFDLGGNSLLAIRLVSRVRAAFSVELPLATLFLSPQLGELAREIAQLQLAGPPASGPPITRRTTDGSVPLSYHQERYWNLHGQLKDDDPLMNIHAAVSIRGSLDVDALRQAIAEIVRRHEVLRTRLVLDETGQPVQQLISDFEMALPVDDLSSLPVEQRDRQVDELSRRQGSQHFDLGRGPLFCVRLLRLGPTEHVFLATMHHIIGDGWSIQVLFHEVALLYDAFSAGYPSPLPELPLQYADYAVWQREYFKSEAAVPVIEFWRKQMAGCERLSMPTDRPVQPLHGIEKSHVFRVSAALRSRLERLAQAENATMYMLTMAVYQAALRRFGDCDDLLVMINTANRNRRETQSLIGTFTNRMILRCDVSGNPTFRELLARVRQTSLESLARQELPVELMTRLFWPDRPVANVPGLCACFGYDQRSRADSLRRHRGLEFRYLPTDIGPTSAYHNFWLGLMETDNGLDGELEFDSALYDDATTDRLLRYFLNLLDDVADDPGRPLSELLARCDRRRDATLDDAAPREDATTPSLEDVPMLDELVSSLMAPSMTEDEKQSGRSLVPLRTGGDGTPLFCIHGLGGHVAAFLPLARGLSTERSVYGLQGRGLDPGQTPHDRIEAMAECYLEEIQGVQPHGPYLLSGWSLGGMIALETAHRLKAAGEQVSLLAMFDTHLSKMEYEKLDLDERSIIRWIAPYLNLSLPKLKRMTLDQQWEEIARQANLTEGFGVTEIRRLAQVCKAHLAAAAAYQPKPYSGRVVLFQAEEPRGRLDPHWRTLCPSLRIESTPGNHYSMLRKPDVTALVERLDGVLKEP
ncbi:MAG: amino acid adenylation domain-containing protein [Thermoguttaceae bacterium]